MKESENILPQDGEAIYLENIFDKQQCTQLFNVLISDIHWQQQEIKMFGKLIQNVSVQDGQTIDITQLAVGAYNVVIKSDGLTKETESLIKMK